ncbi:MAG: MerR family transcriptional regulator [Alphaproteobacteria bacterium]|nr:MAG: MerR family transcriptional regulator [Alphaproteobacteria bacterium]
MKMKELEARTGVGREAIRFYIREGLLPEPVKPKKNVAIYSEAHVARIRIIKKLQDERFLPLSEIREIIRSYDANEPLAPKFRGMEFQLAARLGADALAPVSVKSLISGSALTDQDLKELVEIGLIEIDNSQDAPQISGQDARLARLWAALSVAGFDRAAGFTPHDLEKYRKAAEFNAQEEVDGFFERIPSSRSLQEVAKLAEEGLAIVDEIYTLLHTRAVLNAIARRNADLTDDTQSAPESAAV